MSNSQQRYVQSVEQCLWRVLCLHDVPGIQPEHPEIEFATSPELRLDTVTKERNANECCFIEPTINSARISLKIRQTDELEKWLTRKWISFLTQAAYAEVSWQSQAAAPGHLKLMQHIVRHSSSADPFHSSTLPCQGA